MEQLSRARLVSQLLSMSGLTNLSSNDTFTEALHQLPGLLPGGANVSLLSGISETAGNSSNQGTSLAITDQYLQLIHSNQGLTDFLKRNNDFRCDDKK